VNALGCSCSQLDGDHDSVADCADLCQDTATGATVDANGCACSQRDSDSDGIDDCLDLIPGSNGTENPDPDPGRPDSPRPPLGSSNDGVISGGDEPQPTKGSGLPVGSCGVGAASMMPLSMLGLLSMRRRCRRRRRD